MSSMQIEYSAALASLRAFDLHHALVTDPLGDVPQLLARDEFESISLAPTALSAQALLLPNLTPLRSIPGERQGSLLETLEQRVAAGEAPGFSALWATASSPELCAEHWRVSTLLRSAHSTTWLRLHEARVIHQLRWMLTPSQLGSLLGPIARWTYVLAGEWHSFERLSAAPEAITPDQWQRVIGIGSINKVCRKLQLEQGPAAWNQGPQIEAALQRARLIHRLTEEDDQVDFALRAQTVHPNFDQHPVVADLLAQRDAEDSFRDTFLDIDEAQWQAIAASSPIRQASTK
jgi:hypothetical protein